MESSEINFHPWKNNVLDYVGRKLVSTKTGEEVIVAQAMVDGFMIYVNGVLIESRLSNLAASSVLNRIGCKLA